MKSLKKPLVFSLAAAMTFAGAAALSGCREKGEKYIMFSNYEKTDYEMSLHIEKAEYTLSELEANDYIVPIDIVYTNTSEKAIKYADEVSFSYSMYSCLFTHKESRRYVQTFYVIGRLIWQGVDLFTGAPVNSGDPIYYGYTSDQISYIFGGLPLPGFPKEVEPGESITLTMYYDFSDTAYGEDGEMDCYSNNDYVRDEVLILDGGGSSDDEVDVSSGTNSYNFDYSLGDDEEYLAVGLGSFKIYFDSTKNIKVEDEIPTQAGYYSLVFGTTVFVNCIHITEE